MSVKTFVPYEGAKPSKRQAKRNNRVAGHQAIRDLKRSLHLTAVRAMSGLDEKAKELGIWSDDFHKLPRSERSLLVHKATISLKHAA